MTVGSAIKRTNTIIYCDHWKETVSFYRDRIGLEVASRWDWFVEFRLTATAFLSVADQARAGLSSANGQGLTLSWQVEDLDGAHRWAAGAGLAPTPIRSPVMGADVFYLFDPEGTRIEFWYPA